MELHRHPPAPLERHTLESRYVIERPLGAGGMASVFVARDVRHDRLVALKLVRRDMPVSAAAEERFEREVRIAARLQHPHIVPLYDSGVADGARFYVMPLVEGPSLRRRLTAEGRLGLAEVLRLAAQMAGALDYAHASGIVHRDIKPENILLSDGHALVADFGIARMDAATMDASMLTDPGVSMGTPHYMSPEQAAGERDLDGRSDQYALACVVYELLTGRPPFDGPTLQAVIAQHFVDPVPPLRLGTETPSSALDAVMQRALAKEPSARFATTGEFAAALAEAAQGRATSTGFGAPASAVPVPSTVLIGRQRTLEDALAKLRDARVRLVTFTGPGGTGKTRLAQEAGARLIDDFPGGVWFVPLAAVADADSVPSVVAHALGVHDPSGAALLDLVALRLVGGRVLLILDDFERHTAAASWLSELLARVPSLTVLVTSRVLLHLTMEREFPVPPLEVPVLGTPLASADVMSYPAVQLFAQRARAVDPAFALTDENAAAVAEICVRLDGLPLALELAAARVRLLSPRAILGRLEHRLQLLTGGARDLPERHRTLHQAIAWSFDLLREPERRLFARLSVFTGGCTIEAAEAVCDADDAVGIDILDGIASLLDASLLVREGRGERDAEPRLRMLETIREFAAAAFERDPGAAVVRERHRTWFLDLAKRAAPRLTGAQQETWLAILGAEQGNVRAALLRSVELEDVEAALSFCTAWWRHCLVRGSLAEGRTLLERSLALPAGPALDALRAEVLTGAGTIAQTEGDLVAATDYFSAALDVRRRLGDTAGVARALADLGWVAWRRCDYRESRELSRECLELARRTGNQRCMALAFSNLGWNAMSEGDMDAARDAFTQGLELRRELADRRGVAFMQTGLAWTATRSGDQARALALLEEALASFRAIGEVRLYAFALSVLGEVRLRSGDPRRARSVLESEALPTLRRTGDPWGIAHALYVRAWAALADGETDQAERIATESLDIRRSIHQRHGAAESLALLGDVARRRGDEAGAERLYRESLALRQEIGDALGIAACERALAGGSAL